MPDMCRMVAIKPLDPLFFRINRSFSAGEQDWASSRPFPLPTTVYGAIRTFILSRRDLNVFYEKGYPDIGGPEKKGTLRIRFIALKKHDELFFPIPNNVVCIEGKRKLEVMLPGIREREYMVFSSVKDYPGSLKFFYTRKDVSKKRGQWMRVSALARYLRGEYDSIGCEDVKYMEDFVKPEPRIGIALDRDSRTVREGMLYRAEHYRYLEGVEIVACVEGTREPLTGVLNLGGERRVAYMMEMDGDMGIRELMEPPEEPDFLYMATPSIWKDSWYGKDLCGHLESAFVDSYEFVGGWDMARRRPKPLYRAVASGSLYVFDGTCRGKLKEIHFKNISDVYPEEGYGFALAGVLGSNGG